MIVAEMKGSLNANLQVSSGLLTSRVGGIDHIQPSRSWLTTNPNRYPDTLMEATDPNINQAGQLLECIVANHQHGVERSL